MCHLTAQVNLLPTHCGAGFNHQLSYLSDMLSFNDLRRVLGVTWEARARWYYIGLGIGISPGTLDYIKKEKRQLPEDCLLETLKQWLNQEYPTWSALSRVLKSPSVGFDFLADKVRHGK